LSELRKELDDEVGVRARNISVAIGVLAAIYIIGALVLGIWPFSTARDLVAKTTSAENIIANYQYFYDQKAAIDAQRANVAAAVGSTEYAGMKMVLNNAIAEYNARSKQINRALWKAKDLPQTIPFEEGK
jgi:hypothetical protein